MQQERFLNYFNTQLTTAAFSTQNCYNWCNNAWIGPTPLRGFWIQNGATCNCAAEFDSGNFASRVDQGSAIRQTFLNQNPGKGPYVYVAGSGSHDLYSIVAPTTMDATLVTTGLCGDSNGNTYDSYKFDNFDNEGFGVDTAHQCYDLCKMVGVEKGITMRGFEHDGTNTASCHCVADNGDISSGTTTWPDTSVSLGSVGTGQIVKRAGSGNLDFNCYTYDNPFTLIGRGYYVTDPRGRRMDHFTKTEHGPSTESVYGCYNYCVEASSSLSIQSFGIDSTFSPPSCDCHVNHNDLSLLPSSYATSTYTGGYGYGPQQSISYKIDPGTTEGAFTTLSLNPLQFPTPRLVLNSTA